LNFWETFTVLRSKVLREDDCEDFVILSPFDLTPYSRLLDGRTPGL